MLVSHSNKFIFVKTKKTAGSTVESIIADNFFDPMVDVCTGSKIDGTPRVNIGPKLPNQPDGHRPWHMIRDFVGDQVWNEYHKFTVERNPWEKVVSEFYWKSSREPKMNHHYSDIANFKYFVDNYLGSWYAAPQDWSLYADKDELKVDQVIQYSELSSSLCRMFNQTLGVPLTEDMITGTRKKSGYRKKHYTELYKDQSVIDKVAVMFKKEIQYFLVLKMQRA